MKSIIKRKRILCDQILENPTYCAKCCFELFTILGCMVILICWWRAIFKLSFGTLFEVCTNFSHKDITVCIQAVKISCHVLYGRSNNVLPWLPVCTWRRSPPKKTKQGARHPQQTTEKHRLKFLIAQLCHSLVATAKCHPRRHLFLQLFACLYHGWPFFIRQWLQSRYRSPT